MSENQEQLNQTDQHEGGLEHKTGAGGQDFQAQSEQTQRRPDSARKQVGRGWSPWGMTLVN
jgi:hypothetical protein